MGLKPHQKKAVLPEYFDQAKKTKQLHDPNAFYEQRPSWRVGRIQTQDPFGWHAITADELALIHEKLTNFETMTWGQILMKAATKGPRPHHFVKLNRLCSKARQRLEQIFGVVDFDDMISLRLGGVERIWGIAEGPTMRVVFWDPSHEICPSLKD